MRTVGSRREAALTLAAPRADAAAVAVAASSAALSRRRFHRSDRRAEQRFVVAATHGNPFVSIVNQTKVSSLARVSETVSNRILSEEMWPLYHVEGAWGAPLELNDCAGDCAILVARIPPHHKPARTEG